MNEFKSLLHCPEINPRKFFVSPSGFIIFARKDEIQHEMIAERIMRENSYLQDIYNKVSSECNISTDNMTFLHFYGYITGWVENPKDIEPTNPTYSCCTLPQFLADLKCQADMGKVAEISVNLIYIENSIKGQRNYFDPEDPVYSCCTPIELLKEIINEDDIEEVEKILNIILDYRDRIKDGLKKDDKSK